MRNYLNSQIPRGGIRHSKRYKQLIDYSGFQFEKKITPMDIDFYLEFGGREIVLGEFKQQGRSMSYGQRKGLTVLTMAIAAQGIEVLAFLAHHDSHPDETVNGADCLVVEVFCPREGRGWHSPGKDRRVRELIDSWSRWYRIDRKRQKKTDCPRL